MVKKQSLAGALHVMDLTKDKMITAYRNHVQPIGMGVDPKKVMAELYGKGTGTSSGLGGSMHIFSKEHRFYGGHGIVGGQIPLGAGLAFADKYFNRGGVTLTFMGDGAMRQGSLHETMNLAMFGIYQLFSVLKITVMPWVPLLRELRIIQKFGKWDWPMTCLVNLLME